METKEIKINVPEGMEIDKENSTFECIRFKPIAKRWRDNKDALISGFSISSEDSRIYPFTFGHNKKSNYNVFTTEKQAKSSLAMARISQIMANDPRFGGVISDKEWRDQSINKYGVYRWQNEIAKNCTFSTYDFLSFHTEEQRDLFLKENEDLIEDYLMLSNDGLK